MYYLFDKWLVIGNKSDQGLDDENICTQKPNSSGFTQKHEPAVNSNNSSNNCTESRTASNACSKKALDFMGSFFFFLNKVTKGV